MTSKYLNFFGEVSGYADHTVWIGQVRIGMVVQKVDKGEDHDPHPRLTDVYGHILGFSINPSNEIVLLVRWSDGETSNVHPANVKLLVPNS